MSSSSSLTPEEKAQLEEKVKRVQEKQKQIIDTMAKDSAGEYENKLVSEIKLPSKDIAHFKDEFFRLHVGLLEDYPDNDNDDYDSDEEYKTALDEFLANEDTRDEIYIETAGPNNKVNYGEILDGLTAYDQGDSKQIETLLNKIETISRLEEQPRIDRKVQEELKNLSRVLSVIFFPDDFDTELKRPQERDDKATLQLYRLNKGDQLGRYPRLMNHVGEPTIFWEERTGKGISTLNEEHKTLFGVSLFNLYNLRNDLINKYEKYDIPYLPFDIWLEKYIATKPVPDPTKPYYQYTGKAEKEVRFRSLYESSHSDMKFLRTEEERAPYELKIHNGLLQFNMKAYGGEDKWVTADSKKLKQTDNRGKGILIFAFDVETGKLYAAQPIPGVVHHSTFLSSAGKRVIAGTFTIEDGKITSIANDSGHYRNTQEDFQCLLAHLAQQNILALQKIDVYEAKITGKKDTGQYTDDELKATDVDKRNHRGITDLTEIDSYVKEGNVHLSKLERQQKLHDLKLKAEQEIFSPTSSEMSSPISDVTPTTPQSVTSPTSPPQSTSASHPSSTLNPQSLSYFRLFTKSMLQAVHKPIDVATELRAYLSTLEKENLQLVDAKELPDQIKFISQVLAEMNTESKPTLNDAVAKVKQSNEEGYKIAMDNTHIKAIFEKAGVESSKRFTPGEGT